MLNVQIILEMIPPLPVHYSAYDHEQDSRPVLASKSLHSVDNSVPFSFIGWLIPKYAAYVYK